MEANQANLFTIQEVEISYKNRIPYHERHKINSSKGMYDLLLKMNPQTIDHKESFYCIMLNNSNHINGITKVSEGGITGTVVDIRILFQSAILSNSVAIIIAHNHPSGTLKPSQADRDLTNKIKKAGNFLDVKLLDHIIFTSHSYFSFADEGQL